MDKMVWDSIGYTDTSNLFPGICYDSTNNRVFIVGGNTSGVTYSYYNFYAPSYTSNIIREISLNNNNTFRDITIDYRIMGCAAGYYNNYIYTIGGFRGERGEYISSSSRYFYYIYPMQVIYKYNITENNTSAAITDVSNLPSNMTFPSYIQIDNNLYIFGGGNAPAVNTYSTSTTISQTHINAIEQDVRYAYIFDMATETLISIPPLPIQGGLNINCCYDGKDYIYIRNATQFCRLNIRSLLYDKVTTLTLPEAVFNPEVYYAELNGHKYVMFMSGTTDNRLYSQVYDADLDEVIDQQDDYVVSSTSYYKSVMASNDIVLSFGGRSLECTHNALSQFKKEVV